MVGQTVSHYKILEPLGAGGMGEVYKAQDLKLDRFVALKFLPPDLSRDPDAKQRFIHEAKAASALDHANICTVYEVSETNDGQMFIAMACYQGENLKKKIEQGPLPLDQAVDIVLQAAHGLAKAHESGIVHRDIKPANIIVTDDGTAKILDFGLAKVSGRTLLTKSGTTLGTAAYMSPEQALGETTDKRTDIWSLGVTLYEMLTGKRPFDSDYEQALVYSILNEEPKPIRKVRPEVPEALEQVVQKAMAKRLEDRYQSAGDLLADLKILKGSEESGRATIASRLARKRRLRRIALVAGLALLVAAGVFVVLPIIQENALASNPKTVAVISFENLTGDRNLDPLRNVLQDAIITSLEQSKYFRVTTRERIADILKQIGKKDVEYVDRDLGMEICRRDGAEVLAVGTFASAGELFRTTVKLIDVRTLQPVKTFTANGKGVESLLAEQIDDLSKSISRGFGISERQTQAMIRPIDDIATTSPLAYQLYVRGRREVEQWSWPEARRFFEMALKEDSLFVSAWTALANACGNTGDKKAAAYARGKAVSLFAKASERERFEIAYFDTTFRSVVMGRPNATHLEFLKYRTERFPKDKWFLLGLGADLQVLYGLLDEPIATYTRVLELDPTFGLAYNNLGYAYSWKGDLDKAIETLKRYAAVAPGDPNAYDSMGEVYSEAGKFDEAITSYQLANALKYDLEWSSQKIAMLYFKREDYENALRWNDSAIARAPTPGRKAVPIGSRAYCMYWLGRLRDAESLLRQYGSLLKTIGDESDGFLEAWIAFDRGELATCRSYLKRWILRYTKELSQGRPELLPWTDLSVELLDEFCSGYVDLREGKLEAVERRLARMDSLRNRVPLSDSSNGANVISRTHTEVSWNLRSELLLARGHPEGVPSAVPPFAGYRVRPSLGFFDARTWCGAVTHIPVPVDGLARAYAAMGSPDSAIALYERGMAVPHELFPRYHYRLAKLYDQKGMKDKAIAEYEKFLKIWGKADPIYKEPADARARLAKLKRG